MRRAVDNDGSLAALAKSQKGTLMTTTGELIRMMNYVDDISTTLRRISNNILLMNEEEKKRLAEYMRKSQATFEQLIQTLDQAGSQ
jgi:hypothetical protein